MSTLHNDYWKAMYSIRAMILVLLIVFISNLSSAQITEGFESEVIPGQFSQNGYTFSLTGNLNWEEYNPSAYAGDYLVSNYENKSIGIKVEIKISL
jgi:hypothetical protein